MPNSPEQSQVEISVDAKQEKQNLVAELKFNPENTDHAQVWNSIDKTYGADAYQQLISSYVNKISPDANQEDKVYVSRKSLYRYMQRYDEIRTEFMTTADDLEDKFKEAKDELRKETKKRLRSLRSEIEDIQNTPELIKGMDPRTVELMANPTLDQLDRMMREPNEETFKRLEIVRTENPDLWDDAVEMYEESVIKDSINNGSKESFIKTVNQLRSEAGLEPIKENRFRKAVRSFRDMLDDASERSSRKTIAFLQNFSMEVNGDVLNFETELKPKSLQWQVNRQLDYLTSGLLTPQKDEDQTLVRFMTADLETRNDMLQNLEGRQKLFRAIRMATEMYPKIYAKQFKNVPDDVKKLRYSKRIEKPTYHDRAAQLQALIILGKQSKQIIEQLSARDEHNGEDYENAIATADIPEDIKSVHTGLRFEAPNNQRARYLSGIRRHGFNTRDLALKGAKIFGAFTVFANVMQAWTNAGDSSEDIIDRIANTIEGTASSQGAIAGAAVATGAHMAERDPRLLKYPWLSQHERADVISGLKMDRIRMRVGGEELSRFTNNAAEWRAMNHPKMTSDKIREMVKAAGKNTKKGQRPQITLEDMKNAIDDPSIGPLLTRGGESGHTRYMFYQKFLMAKNKPDINQLKELCTGESHISSNPVKNA